jgi:hypothetical protein
MTNTVDRKFEFTAVNPCNGKVYTQENAIVFCAKDKALVAALVGYSRVSKFYGSNPEHLESIALLIERVKKYQEEVGSKTPDTIGDCEIDRCIGGILKNDGK